MGSGGTVSGDRGQRRAFDIFMMGQPSATQVIERAGFETENRWPSRLDLGIVFGSDLLDDGQFRAGAALDAFSLFVVADVPDTSFQVGGYAADPEGGCWPGRRVLAVAGSTISVGACRGGGI